MSGGAVESALRGKRVLVLGGWGLVGSAICRELLHESPGELFVHSLRAHEAETAVRELRERRPEAGTRLVPLHGNVFVPLELKDESREAILADPATRERLLEDIYGELSPRALTESTLFHLLTEHRPQLVVDCVNTATAFAYQNLYDSVRDVRRILDEAAGPDREDRLAAAAREQLDLLQVPQLVRHVQVLFEGLVRAGTELYLKIGTTGTGGMGLNIPYTHSEEKPSRLLLSKSALAGAHSMLLFLMGSTPRGPVIKEIKPAAAVAWKAIGSGPVLRRGRPLPLYDCPLESAASPERALRPDAAGWTALDGQVLEAAFVDTGENGMFSLEEFETVTALGQMEFVTPEEIARHALVEIKGGGTGREIVRALAGACLGPSYRAGVLRREALDALVALDSDARPSVAFEMLGPPRLSKLLWEAHLLGRACRPLSRLPERDAAAVASAIVELLREEPPLRARILSIGVPILLPDGRLLRGPEVKTPPDLDVLPEHPAVDEVDRWARAGWVDLRTRNVALWQERVRAVGAERARASAGAGDGSGAMSLSAGGADARAYAPGRLAAWIFAHEEGGERLL
ncbi:MAG: short-chain dehydrogenase [Gemmatimonadota bacterium]